MHETVDLDLHFHGELKRAIRVSENGVLSESVYLPLSEIADMEISRDRRSVRVTIPLWLADKEGLI